MKLKKLLTIFIVLLIAIILNIFDIKLCPIFNIFKIPCPGCGMTQSFVLLLKGKVIESLSYNILTIPIVLSSVFYVIMVFIDKEKLVEDFMIKHKKAFIIISIIVTLIVWIININNPKLY